MKKNLSRGKKRVIFAIIGLILVGAVVFWQLKSRPVAAAWFNDSWLYRKAINITNSSGGALTDFQVSFTLDTTDTTRFRSDCADIRITDANGKKLPYWLEGPCNNSSSKVWAKVPSLPTTGQTIYVYYGNPSAVSESSTAKVFIREISGVQGAWSMDEASWNNDCNTNTVLDTSGNSNHGKSCPAGSGPTGGATGKFNNGGSFDGGNDYVQVTDNSSLDATSAVTISAWINPSGTQAEYGRIIFKGDGDATWAYGLAYDSTGQYVRMLSYTSTSAVSISTSTVTSGWHHIVGIYDGSTQKLYVDGTRVDSDSQSGNLVNAGNLGIGAEVVGVTRYFKGTLDEARIYNRALTDTEITDIYSGGGNNVGYVTTNYPNKELIRKYAATNPTATAGSEEQGTGPVAYWKFDEGTGTTANDSTANRNAGTLTNMSSTPATNSGWIQEDACIAGKCLGFDGINDYVDVTNGVSLDANNFSVSFWYRSPAYSGDRATLIAQKGAASNYLKIDIDNISSKERIRAYLDDGGVKAYYYTNSLSALDNKWHYITVVRDNTADKIYIYVDGTDDTIESTNLDNSYSVNDSNLDLGRDSLTSTDYFKGYMDEVKIYNYARTADQIKTEYSAASANHGGSTQMGANAGNLPDSLSNGLVGYWKMDEATWSGTINEVLDSSGNGNNGQAQGAAGGKAYPSAGKFGNGGYFDGVDDYVKIADSTSLQSAKAITISSWVKVNSFISTNYPRVISKGGSFSIVIMSSGVVQFTLITGAGQKSVNTSSGAVQTNAWYHIITTYDGSSTAKIYVDGIVKAQDSISQGSITYLSRPTVIGCAGGTSGCDGWYMNALIDDVRIYNRALSAKEVRDLYNWAPPPVALWSFEEGQGASVYDKSGNSNTGTWAGTGSRWTTGKIGKAGKFNGSDDYVDAGNPATINFTTDNFSLSSWINTSLISGNTTIIEKRNGATGALIRLEIRSNKYQCNMYDGSNNPGAVALSNVATNTWAHVTCVVNNDGNTVALYINGVLQNTSTTTFGSLGNAGSWYIGKGNDQLKFNGLLDDVKFYNYARSQKQIVEDINAGHPAVGSPVGTAVGYWKFDEGYGTTTNNSGSRGNSLNATLNTSSWNLNGKFGKGISITGSSGSNVSIPDFNY